MQSFRTDIIERKIDVAFVQETWEHTEKESHKKEIEAMLDFNTNQIHAHCQKKVMHMVG